MRNRHLEKGGHAVIIVVIVLAVAVVGLLGFVFWQNFINKPGASQDSSLNNDNNADDSALSETSSLEIRGVTASINYPASWKFEGGELEQPFGGDEELFRQASLTSPDGKVVLYYTLGDLTGIGGTCYDSRYEASAPKPSLVSLDWNAIAGAKQAIFVSSIHRNYIADGDQDGYRYWFGVYKNDDAVKSLKAGADEVAVCTALGYAQFVEADKQGDKVIALQLYGFFTDMAAGMVSDSVDKTKEAFESDTAKTAKSIMESLKITK